MTTPAPAGTRLSCPHTKRYMAKKPPKCGCVACSLKWLNAQVEYLTAYVQSARARRRYEEEREWYL